jgi:Cof subfamily protein (haloacid dehalogenase superfamily)
MVGRTHTGGVRTLSEDLMQRDLPAFVATDLDGTLVRSDGSVGRRTLQALEDVQDAGAVVVFVTGRPPRWLQPVADITGHRGVAICANGALVLDLASNDVLDTHSFVEGTGLETLTRLRDELPELSFGVEWADGFAHETTYPRGVRQSENARGAAQSVETVEELFARPVVKLLARHATLSSDDLAERLRAVVEDVATVTHSSVGLLEVSARGVTKAYALERFVAEQGAERDDVIAFGDMPNDVAMLRWAGWSVAVANAHPAVREVADEVTASNDEDGVGVVLERRLGR